MVNASAGSMVTLRLSPTAPRLCRRRLAERGAGGLEGGTAGAPSLTPNCSRLQKTRRHTYEKGFSCALTCGEERRGPPSP